MIDINNINQIDEYFLKSDSEKSYLKNRDLIIQTIEVFNEIESNKSITETQKEIIKSGLLSNFECLSYNIIGKKLFTFSEQYEFAENYIKELLNSTNSKIRFNCIVNAQLCKNKELKKLIYSTGLRDRSERVVIKTIEEILRGKRIKKDFRKEISKIIQNVKNENSKEWLEISLQLNKNGYAFVNEKENQCWVYLKSKEDIKWFTIKKNNVLYKCFLSIIFYFKNIIL